MRELIETIEIVGQDGRRAKVGVYQNYRYAQKLGGQDREKLQIDYEHRLWGLLVPLVGREIFVHEQTGKLFQLVDVRSDS